MSTGRQPFSAELDQSEPQPPELTYSALFLRFLRFGLLAFGGPVAQIAMIRRELVDEEKWIGSASFNKLLAVMQVLPGPEAHELCVHLGIRAKGRLGGLLAGLGFMLPGLCLMLALAWAYTRLPLNGTLLGAVFLGVQAAVLAVIARAVHRIGEHILLDKWLSAAVILAATASALGVSFWIVLPAAGAGYAFASTRRYLLASGVLPAPLVIFATFVGWVSAGPIGALAITAGMFLPAFAFSMLFYERLEAIAEHKRLQLFLAGVAAGVVGVIVVTLFDLGRVSVCRTPNLLISLLIFAGALAVMYKWKSKLATPVVLAGGALVGLMLLR